MSCILFVPPLTFLCLSPFLCITKAVERVLFYTEHIPHEAPATSDELEKHADSLSPPPKPSDAADFAVVASGGKAIQTTPEWPTYGSIKLNDLVMRYREGTPVVLKGLSVSIGGGERVGVVGRTGSEFLCLFVKKLSHSVSNMFFREHRWKV